MGNKNCCFREPPEFKEINISQKIIQKMTNDEINYKIEIIRSEKFNNICFAVVYGIGTMGGIVIFCLSVEPSVGISTFLMASSLTYYIKSSIKSQNDIYKYIEELEKRKYFEIKSTATSVVI